MPALRRGRAHARLEPSGLCAQVAQRNPRFSNRDVGIQYPTHGAAHLPQVLTWLTVQDLRDIEHTIFVTGLRWQIPLDRDYQLYADEIFRLASQANAMPMPPPVMLRQLL